MSMTALLSDKGGGRGGGWVGGVMQRVCGLRLGPKLVVRLASKKNLFLR